MLFSKKKLYNGLCDVQHNDTLHNDTQHNDTQHNNCKCYTQHNSLVHDERRYAECRYVDSRGCIKMFYKLCLYTTPVAVCTLQLSQLSTTVTTLQ